jgi:hypothetical protein
LKIDEIRIGTNYLDVAPYTPPGTAQSPLWLSVSLAGSSVSLQLTGAATTTYDVLASLLVTNTSPWDNIGSLTTDANGLGSFTDTNVAATNDIRFYRAYKP